MNMEPIKKFAADCAAASILFCVSVVFIVAAIVAIHFAKGML